MVTLTNALPLCLDCYCRDFLMLGQIITTANYCRIHKLLQNVKKKYFVESCMSLSVETLIVCITFERYIEFYILFLQFDPVGK